MTAAAVAALALTLAAQQAPLAQTGEEIVAVVRESFFDARRAAAWAAASAGYAKDLAGPGELADATRERLAALAASHTEYYRPDDLGYHDLLAIFEPVLKRSAVRPSLGVGWREIDGRWFVARVFPGGPAERAGLLSGDRVVAADGEPFHPVRSLTAGRAAVLSVERQRGAPRIEVTATPVDANPKAEWLAAQKAATRILERGDKKLGYAPLWSCAGSEHYELLAEALAGDLAAADALVLDQRGGWGGCDLRMVALFDPAVPQLESIGREERSVFSPAWRKPLVVLIDGGSRSGKEVFARAIQRSGRGTLVGERTAGAVLAGRPFLLHDGSLLYLAVADVKVDGERLEGVGVAPEVAVPWSLPYTEGKDPQLERALEVAASYGSPG
jgi:carboxyl-terminal processing protease